MVLVSVYMVSFEFSQLMVSSSNNFRKYSEFKEFLRHWFYSTWSLTRRNSSPIGATVSTAFFPNIFKVWSSFSKESICLFTSIVRWKCRYQSVVVCKWVWEELDSELRSVQQSDGSKYELDPNSGEISTAEYWTSSGGLHRGKKISN